MVAKRKYDPEKRRARYLREKERAQALGYSSPSQATRQRRAQREGRTYTPLPGSRVLRKLGVTRAEFERMRAENIRHDPEGTGRMGQPRSQAARKIQTYRTDIDARTNDWSEARVGYIVSFNQAVVNQDTNFYSMKPNERWLEENANTPKFLKWRDIQLSYLVRYGGVMDLDEFDEKYGDSNGSSTIIMEALRKAGKL